jgi:membrane protein YqaA with SNARE-associated domain
MYRSGADKRTELGGYISWKEALTPTWLTAVVSSFLGTIFNWILVRFIDPSLQEKQREQAIKMTEKMRSWIGDAETEKKLEELETQDFASIGNYILVFFMAILFYFVIASLVSLILKKKKSEDIFSKY